MLAAGLTLLHYKSFSTCPSLPALRARCDAEFDEHRKLGIHVLVSQGDDGRLILGDSHEYGREFAPGSSERVEGLILGYLRRFLRIDDWQISNRWTGTYSLRTQGESILRLHPLQGVQLVTGVGGSGMTRSMAIGEQTLSSLTN
jgi:glycine/D-amino acid oxidase-like deaminating enzyme